MSNKKLAYHSFRLAMGISILIHGAVRIPKLTQVADGISAEFADTLLQGTPSLIAGYFIPLAELLVGIGILIGWKVIRYALAAGIALMGILMIGTCLIENWAALPSQIIHAIAFYLLLMSSLTWQPRQKDY
ncbi:hypothetical protein AAU57_09905 [Nonlabens sp. YIK11]|uniref:hypothetical protein n=1 Tax=Nonlabens sp. YIK11 TaxID=1453349 RepID=UPI0006DC57C5|nr:hypothetical protein [Nonlabens sp. YIK11]KQC33598.1 hypothetical protein AAU57_09905 [Nonlabens sp. YIK11]